MSLLPIYQVDAFTDRAYSGNPAAVCLVQPTQCPPQSDRMQQIAAELNLSETAFVMSTAQQAGDQQPVALGFYPQMDRLNIRYFTPKVEVPLCGHATLASAHLIWNLGIAPFHESVSFQTVTGERLACQRAPDGWITMDFPSDPPLAVEAPAGLLAAIGIKPIAAARSRDWLIEVATEAELLRAKPDFPALCGFERGVILTAACSAPNTDFVSRCFYPALGVNEDPVTGSAHCALAPYWQRRLGKDMLEARQVSSRGGQLRLTCGGDRVGIAGCAVTKMRGEWLV